MDGINKSLAAIQTYQPQNHVYLRVVGKGSNQYLESVKMNWFFRVLMWLGISSASMKKVAKYVAENIDALCNAGPTKSLEGLVDRIKKYDKRRCFKITPLVNKITGIYNEKKALAHALVISVIPPTPISKPLVVIDKPQNPVAVKPPQIAPIAVPTSVQTPVPKPASKPVNKPAPTPIVAVPVAVPVTPIPPVNPNFEGVEQFKKIRGHIAKVGGLLDASTASMMKGIRQASNELSRVLALLRDNKDNPGNFGAIIKEMTPQEVFYYAAFGFYQSEEKKKAFPKLCVDVFGIKSDKFGDISKVMELAVQYMSLAQLKSCIEGISKYCPAGTFNAHSRAFYNLAHLVEKHRSKDKETIFKEMVTNSFFTSNIFLEYPHTYLGTLPSEIMDLLATHYLLYLLREPKLTDRKKLLNEFIEATLFKSNRETNLSSPLQKASVFSVLTLDEQVALASSMLRTYNSIIDPVFELVMHILTTEPKKGIALFNALGEHRFYYGFCCQIRQKVPAAEKEYLIYLLRDPNLIKKPKEQHDRLTHFMKHGQPDVDGYGALEDSTFVATLTPDEIHSIGLAIIYGKGLPWWDKFYVFREIIMKDKAYALRLYQDAAKYDPKFNRPMIPFYCSSVNNMEILNHLEDNMNTQEKEAWASSLVNIYSETEEYSKLNTLGKNSKVAEIIASILKSQKK